MRSRRFANHFRQLATMRFGDVDVEHRLVDPFVSHPRLQPPWIHAKQRGARPKRMPKFRWRDLFLEMELTGVIPRRLLVRVTRLEAEGEPVAEPHRLAGRDQVAGLAPQCVGQFADHVRIGLTAAL